MADGLSALLGAAGASNTKVYDGSYIDGIYEQVRSISGRVHGEYKKYNISPEDMRSSVDAMAELSKLINSIKWEMIDPSYLDQFHYDVMRIVQRIMYALKAYVTDTSYSKGKYIDEIRLILMLYKKTSSGHEVHWLWFYIKYLFESNKDRYKNLEYGVSDISESVMVIILEYGFLDLMYYNAGDFNGYVGDVDILESMLKLVFSLTVQCGAYYSRSLDVDSVNKARVYMEQWVYPAIVGDRDRIVSQEPNRPSIDTIGLKDTYLIDRFKKLVTYDNLLSMLDRVSIVADKLKIPTIGKSSFDIILDEVKKDNELYRLLADCVSDMNWANKSYDDARLLERCFEMDCRDKDGLTAYAIKTISGRYGEIFPQIHNIYQRMYPVYKESIGYSKNMEILITFRKEFHSLCENMFWTAYNILYYSKDKDNSYAGVKYVFGLLSSYVNIRNKRERNNSWYFFYASQYIELIQSGPIYMPSDVDDRVSIILTKEFYDMLLKRVNNELGYKCEDDIKYVVQYNSPDSPDLWRNIKRLLAYTSSNKFKDNNAVKRFAGYLDAVSYYALLGDKKSLLDFLKNVPELQPDESMDENTELVYKACKLLSSKEFLVKCCDEVAGIKSENKAPKGVPVL